MSEEKSTSNVSEDSKETSTPLGSDAFIHCFACGSKVTVEGKKPGDGIVCSSCETKLTVPDEEVLKKLSSFESFTEIGNEELIDSDEVKSVPHKIFCKGCNAKLDVTDQPVGARFSCPACGMVLSVPEKDGAKKKATGSFKKKATGSHKKGATATLEKLKINCHTCSAKIDVTGEEAFKKVNCPACNAQFQIPKRFSHFLLEERLGENPNFSVYRALDLTLSREVCLKVMSSELSAKKEMVDSFLSMAGKVALISDPNIVPIYSSGEHDGQCFLVMQYMSASSLDPYLEKAKGLLPLSSVYRSIRDASKGLESAFKQGLNHNNLSLKNILVDRDGNIKVSDFGYSYSLHKIDKESELISFFNPKYISRELAQGEENGLAGDIYSLGAVFYHLITGVAPFPGNNPKDVIKQRIERKPVEPIKVRNEIPERVSEFIMTMMADEQSERPSSFAEVIKKIEEFMDPDAKPSTSSSSGPSNVKVAPTSSSSETIASASVASTTGPSGPSEDAEQESGPKLNPMIIGGAAAALVIIIILVSLGGGSNPKSGISEVSSNPDTSNTQPVDNNGGESPEDVDPPVDPNTSPDLTGEPKSVDTEPVVEPVENPISLDANAPLIKRGHPVKISARPLPAGISFRPYTEEIIGYMDLHDGDSYDQEAVRVKVLKGIKPYMENLIKYVRYKGKLYVKGRDPIDGEIVAVSVRTLTIKPANNDATLPLSWNKFETKQFVEVLQYYINMRTEQLDGATSEIRNQINKDLANDYFRLAMLADWYGIKENLENYTKKCIELDPSLRPQVETLLPSINE